MRRAQVASELILIMGLSLLVVLIFTLLSSISLSDASLQHNYREARDSVQRLADASEYVYAQGEGAFKTVFITIPQNANLSSGSSYIGKPPGAPSYASPRAININIGGSDVSAYTSMQLVGSLPSTWGKYVMKVTARPGYVAIYPNIVELDRHSVFVRMGAGESRQERIMVYGTANGSVNVNANYSWAYADASLSLSAYSFTANATGSPLVLTFSSNNSSYGLHDGLLLINASMAGANESLQVPLNLDIQPA